MGIKIEKEKCLGCGMCASSCPDAFKIGSDGKADAINPDCCGKCCGCDIKETAENCPAGAIKIKE